MKILHQDEQLLVLRCGSYLRGVVLVALLGLFDVWFVMRCVQKNTLDKNHSLALTVLTLIGAGIAAMLGEEGRVRFDKRTMTAEVRLRRLFLRTRRLVFPLDAVSARLVVDGNCARYDIVVLESGKRITLTRGVEGPYNTTIPPKVRAFLSSVRRSTPRGKCQQHGRTTTIAPSELESFQQYREVGLNSILLRALNKGVMVWLLIGCLVVSGVFVFMGLPVPAVTCFLAMIGVILLIGYCQGRLGGIAFRCSKCRQPMEAIDLPVTSDQSTTARGRSARIVAADGYVYFADSATSKGGGWSFDIVRELQRWYLCTKCMRRFLGVKRLFDPILQTDDREQFERAKSLLESDPDAVEKIKRND